MPVLAVLHLKMVELVAAQLVKSICLMMDGDIFQHLLSTDLKAYPGPCPPCAQPALGPSRCPVKQFFVAELLCDWDVMYTSDRDMALSTRSFQTNSRNGHVRKLLPRLPYGGASANKSGAWGLRGLPGDNGACCKG